jgi:hypothetical protein
VSQFEVVAIEEHLLVCPLCSERLRSAREFALAMRDAARIITTELVATHSTDDGLVYLYVRQIRPDNWVATIRGEDIEGGVTGASRQTAVDLCVRSFEEMFPEHRCNARCSAPDVP